MTRLELSPHPVRLLHLSFPEFQFKRLTGGEPPYLFPALELEARKSVEIGRRQLMVSLQIASAKSKAGAKKKAVASFKIRVAGVFECAEFDDAERALSEFSNSASPYQLMWPYVRPLLAR